MKIVMFNDGTKIKVHDKVANEISKRLLSKDGIRNWQTFTEESTGELILIFDMNKVNCIISNENIL